jgi:hypothetical protein
MVGLEMADRLMPVGFIAGSTCTPTRWLGMAQLHSREDELTLACPLAMLTDGEVLGLMVQGGREVASMSRPRRGCREHRSPCVRHHCEGQSDGVDRLRGGVAHLCCKVQYMARRPILGRNKIAKDEERWGLAIGEAHKWHRGTRWTAW